MSTRQSTADIDVGSIWMGVRRMLPILAICTIVAGALTYGVLSLVAPRYEAETQMTVTAKTTNPYATNKTDAGTAASVTPRLDPAAINTHVRALMASDLLLKVGRELNLGQLPEFNSAMGPTDTVDGVLRLLGLSGPRAGETVESRVLAAMRQRLTVSAIRESRFITVRFASSNPELAANVANAIAEAYQRSLREIPVRETNDAVAALLPKIKQLGREVFEAEAQAKRFRAETDQLTGGSTTLTLQQQRLTQLSADLVRSEAERSKAEARLEAAQELSVRGGADTLPEVQNSRIIQDLISQRVRVERQVNEARAVLLPAHPRMRQLNADLRGLRTSIRNEIATIVRSISKEVRLSQLRNEQLKTQIATLKKTAVAKSGDEAKLRSLDTTAKSKRNELERLQRQLEDNRTVVDTNRVPVESTIVSTARASDKPVFPRKTSSAILVMAATFMLGSALVIARELMRSGGPMPHNRRASDQGRKSTRRGSGDAGNGNVAPEKHQSVAQSMQLAGSRPIADSAMTARAHAGATAPSVDGVHGHLSIADYTRSFSETAPAGGGFRTLLAGNSDTIDPSDEAIELAAEFSDQGARVLMIDWSLTGQPLLADIDVGTAGGLSDLMAQRVQFDDILVELPDTNVHYVYTSRDATDANLLDEDALNVVLDALDESYDHVIVFGRHADSRALFEAIEGRFDAGVTIAEPSVGTNPASTETFLGFDVTDIQIVHYVRSVVQVGAIGMASHRGRPASSQRV